MTEVMLLYHLMQVNKITKVGVSVKNTGLVNFPPIFPYFVSVQNDLKNKSHVAPFPK